MEKILHRVIAWITSLDGGANSMQVPHSIDTLELLL
jgi:hypothetical protein